METISIENLIPKDSSFKLTATGQEYRLRPANLADQIFLKNELKSDLGDIVKDPAILCRYAYRLMTEETKDLLAAKTVKFRDEAGAEFTEPLGGVKLFICLVRGPKEVIEIQKAILLSHGVDEKLLEEIEKDAQKKTLSPQPQSIGQESLTPSQQNMDGTQNTSLAVPEEKLLGAWTA